MDVDGSTARYGFGTNACRSADRRRIHNTDTQVRWSTAVLRQQPEWYASPGARAIADNVIRWQSPHGGWPKNTDLAAPPPLPEAITEKPASGGADTIDNGATTTPMRFLALIMQATRDARYRVAFDRGVDYLLAAQYQSGGWPQYFPLRNGYYSHITYNDDAMVKVLTLLRDASAGKPPYDFVDAARRARAAAAVARGIECILRTQLKQNGKLTAWCRASMTRRHSSPPGRATTSRQRSPAAKAWESSGF